MNGRASAGPFGRFPRTKTARLARQRLAQLIERPGSDLELWQRVQQLAPEAWATLAEDIDCEEPKIKITIRLDASVVRLFRAMGKGHQARMNRILATYTQMKIGEVERQRSIQDEADLLFRQEAPDWLEAFWRENREALLASPTGDLSFLDRIYGTGDD